MRSRSLFVMIIFAVMILGALAFFMFNTPVPPSIQIEKAVPRERLLP